jgi:hypothetical protein
VQGVKHAADDVVEHDCEQQQTPADQQAEDEDPVGEIELDQRAPPRSERDSREE